MSGTPTPPTLTYPTMIQPIRVAPLLALIMLIAPTLLWAAEEAPLPPPTPRAEQRHSPIHIAPQRGNNLQQALNPNAKHNGASDVDIRAYTRKDGTKISEYSRHGHVYMIKVQPPGNLPAYYLYDRAGNGAFTRLPGGYKAISPPQWILKEF
ncbi:MAG: DUF2782 domain-containing protein [Mariprofundales bacterium]|nr:DUF2782 domain-containing protein [Mariprofundales bacterium]